MAKFILLLLSQTGTKVIPCDFIAPVESQNPISAGVHHEVCNLVIIIIFMFED